MLYHRYVAGKLRPWGIFIEPLTGLGSFDRWPKSAVDRAGGWRVLLTIISLPRA